MSSKSTYSLICEKLIVNLTFFTPFEHPPLHSHNQFHLRLKPAPTTPQLSFLNPLFTQFQPSLVVEIELHSLGDYSSSAMVV